jgi:hypothetical protein
VAPVLFPHLRKQAVRGAGNLALPPGIEGVEMRKGYYNPMRNLAIILPFFAGALFPGGPTPQPKQATMSAASVESHEGVTISAQPWTDAEQYKENFPKKSPLAAGVVAIKTIFRNDTDESMKIGLEQIRLNLTLSEDNRQELHPLSPEDVADVMMDSNRKDPTVTHRLPFPIPSSGPTGKRDKHWRQMQKAAADAAIPGVIVAPHHSMQGLLYFDLRGQFDLLSNAHLYIPDVRSLEKNHPLLYFEIDLGK